ncbi:MAG: hypothetical protein IPO78_16735 [Saprospiraceae bacterium]|nr:hypothetical protein [Saprospiraceae bacterium]
MTLYMVQNYLMGYLVFGILRITKPVRISDQITSKHLHILYGLKKNRPILYTADEVEAAVIEAWDISDPLNIKKQMSIKLRMENHLYHTP